MNVIVFIKQVPGTTNVRMDPATGAMLRDPSDTVLNPLDEHAITEAAKIKDGQPGTVVTALTMGPPSAVKALQEACARGADQGVLLSHKAFAGSDTIATSRALAAAVRKLGPVDLILAGEKSIDGETGQVGPMTAAMLELPAVTFVRRLNLEGGRIRVQRLVEDGVEELAVTLPALVTVVRDINNPPLPSLRRYVMAKKMTFPVWGPEELGLKETDTGLKASPTRVVKVFSPKFARSTAIFRADGEAGLDASVQAVIDLLRTKEILKKGGA
ncbi:MAG: electron transfer flavoprotein subunit beta/FixA family protein [Armatimonadetes bacterium]|nr:electron transfer flavoprotein subunit beta/FixA family protein [Armatimonadota bacterium]